MCAHPLQLAVAASLGCCEPGLEDCDIWLPYYFYYFLGILKNILLAQNLGSNISNKGVGFL